MDEERLVQITENYQEKRRKKIKKKGRMTRQHHKNPTIGYKEENATLRI